MTHDSIEIAYQKFISKLGELFNSQDPETKLRKLIVMEYSLNPECIEYDYEDVVDLVLQRAAMQYSDPELWILWEEYKEIMYQFAYDEAA